LNYHYKVAEGRVGNQRTQIHDLQDHRSELAQHLVASHHPVDTHLVYGRVALVEVGQGVVHHGSADVGEVELDGGVVLGEVGLLEGYGCKG